MPGTSLKVNQDSLIVMPEFSNVEKGYLHGKMHLFGICDGHGKDGKTISQFVSLKIPEVFKRIQSSGKDLYQAINLTIIKVEEELLKRKSVNCKMSGTTC